MSIIGASGPNKRMKGLFNDAGVAARSGAGLGGPSLPKMEAMGRSIRPDLTTLRRLEGAPPRGPVNNLRRPKVRQEIPCLWAEVKPHHSGERGRTPHRVKRCAEAPRRLRR